MAIQFTTEDWARIKETYAKWWEHELDRPLVPVRLWGKDPGRTKPSVPYLTQAVCDNLSIASEALIDRIDYELSQYEFLGDAFPYYNMDSFGPGVVAAFLGAELVVNSTGLVWFFPKKLLPVKELHFEYDPNNVWLNRIKDIYAAGMKRWKGQVLMGMPDLGSPLDLLSTFRPGENLLYDLYDYPEEVERLVWELHELWMRYYKEFNEVLQPVNPGYSDWSELYSDKPSYIIQSDISYMLGPDMFQQFVKPEMEAVCRKLDRSIYHLDGVGQLKHLDPILTIKELDAVQWIAGAGQPVSADWPQVHKQVLDAGKNVQVWGDLADFHKMMRNFPGGKGIHIHPPLEGRIVQKAEFAEVFRQYGISI